MTDQHRPHGITRRQFAASATTAATVFNIVPRHVLGGAGHQAPSERVDLAAIGAGGQGGTRGFLYAMAARDSYQMTRLPSDD